ncbi:MAG TPA: hypothetical protein VNC39_11920 [Acidocella sp.]|uniref:hypothetical protein n=1 Tax=Acidocella sp. TaxID=50710 RepID=UPI002BD2A47A|nr:hypothetical protein [Acidocella sp.]HVE22677.1 hypothetical protein [Acidocella sp.]
MIKWAVIGFCLALAVLGILLAASGCFVAAFYLWVAPHLGRPAAAAVTGAVLVVLALCLALAGGASLRRMRRRPRRLLGEFQNTIGLVARLMLARDPKKALLASLLAGALAEYILSPGRKR